jgi:hypothetical protein
MPGRIRSRGGAGCKGIVAAFVLVIEVRVSLCLVSSSGTRFGSDHKHQSVHFDKMFPGSRQPNPQFLSAERRLSLLVLAGEMAVVGALEMRQECKRKVLKLRNTPGPYVSHAQRVPYHKIVVACVAKLEHHVFVTHTNP